MKAGYHHNWELLLNLTRKTIKVKYKQSAFGIGWAIIQPLALMLIFVLIFSTLLKIPSDGLPYALFVYSALLPWTLFATSLSTAVPSIEASAGLLRKLYMPRVLFPTAAVMAGLVDFGIGFVIFLGIMLWYKVAFTYILLWIIPVLAVQLVFTLGLCYLLAPLNAYYRDVRAALPLTLQVWMYATPIIYPLSRIPESFRVFYMLNPMAGVIDSWRNVLAKGVAPDLSYLGIAAIGAVLLFMIGYFVFKKTEMTLADVT